MHVEAHLVTDTREPGAVEVGWFAARQPGIIRFLEERLLGGDGDAFGVALVGAWRIASAFEGADGVPPPRVSRSLLDRAAAAVDAETRHGAADGCAARQPELVAWLGGYVGDPPAPISAAEAARVAACLAAVIYAIDQLTTGRPIP